MDFIRRHSAEGRLSTEELADRVGLALSATTLGQLDDLVTDLPAEPVVAPLAPREPPERHWRRPPQIRAMRFAAVGLFLMAMGEPGGEHHAVFALWIVMLFLLRFVSRAERRSRREARLAARAVAPPPPADLGEWHPPQPESIDANAWWRARPGGGDRP